jgi:hypothetical protein
MSVAHSSSGASMAVLKALQFDQLSVTKLVIEFDAGKAAVVKVDCLVENEDLEDFAKVLESFKPSYVRHDLVGVGSANYSKVKTEFLLVEDGQ